MRASRTFEEALDFGEEGEHLIARRLMQSGIAVAPLYQFQNHDRAPVLLFEVDGEHFSRVLPDLTCWNRRQFFVEVKRKTRWVNWRPAGRGLETGFDLRLFRNYRVIRNTTGADVWVFFIHEGSAPTGVFVAELETLVPLVREWDGKTPDGREVERNPLALFPLKALRKRWDLSEIGIASPQAGLFAGVA